ncbi:MAG: thioredoxin family protein [Chloroflexi bacterium]|nr:thioredoxin family protein [Chloroflexota bacterium]
MESSRITADVVEVSEFPELAQRYRIYGVPKTVINEHVSFEGALPEPVFLQQVLRAVAGGSTESDAKET